MFVNKKFVNKKFVNEELITKITTLAEGCGDSGRRRRPNHFG